MSQDTKSDEILAAEKEAYDAFLNYWVANDSRPTASMCPARFMKEGELRNAVIRGWSRAKKESEA